MIVRPTTWGFICTSAHPDGCAANVHEQIGRVRDINGSGPKRVLVIGASTGYGLAARITAAFGYNAATLGVFLEKRPRRKRTASAGWYNSAAFEQAAADAGLTSVSLNADAFAHATRERAIELIRSRLGGPVDLVIYSLASPQRKLPGSGEVVQSALKPIDKPFDSVTIDTDNDRLEPVHVDPASQAEIDDTVAVMGGEDWQLWMNALREADVLTADARTVAFSYDGPELTWPIYRHGTIGRAKAHLGITAQAMSERAERADFARVATLKSVVTQASAAIPAIPLYLSVVSRVMREQGVEEMPIDQQKRLFVEHLYPGEASNDSAALRLDDRELHENVQAACRSLWQQVDNANLADITDYQAYKRRFLNLFGFERDDIDYAAEVDIHAGFRPETVA